MPSSKYPVDFIPVPQKIIELSKLDPRILCNLRPEQRSGREAKRLFLNDEYLMHTSVNNFLDRVTSGNVIIHFQGYGSDKSGTAIVKLDKVEWAFHSKYPRLDFVHPPVLDEIHGCPNFWGAFILAIAKVSNHAKPFAQRDDDAEIFVQSVSKPVLLE